MTFTKYVSASLGIVLVLSLGMSLARAYLTDDAIETGSWQTAPRNSSGMAPDPVKFADTAIVQVYAAPTYGWRGLLAVHPWIILKRAGETEFTRYEVIGWGGNNVIHRNDNIPDGMWYGTRPHLLVDQRGKHVEALIDQIEAAIKTYPYPHTPIMPTPARTAIPFLPTSGGRYLNWDWTFPRTPLAKIIAQSQTRLACLRQGRACRRHCSGCWG